MTWENAQNAIRSALVQASGLSDSSVAWNIGGNAPVWRSYPRVKLEPMGTRDVGLPDESHTWDSDAALMRVEMRGVTYLRVQVKVETERGSAGLGAPFQPGDRIRKVLRSTSVRAGLAAAGVSILSVGEFTPFADDVESRELVIFIGEVLFHVYVPQDITPPGTGGDWFNRVQIFSDLDGWNPETIEGETMDGNLISGAGLPVYLPPFPFTGSGGTDRAQNVVMPRLLPLVTGHRYRISGVFLVSVGATVLATVAVSDHVLYRDALVYIELRPGDIRRGVNLGWDTYFASENDLPGLGINALDIQVNVKPRDGFTVTVEFRGVIADFGSV